MGDSLAGGRDSNAVTEDANWRARCRAEHEAAWTWKDTWGFLADPSVEEDTLTSFARKVDAISTPKQGGKQWKDEAMEASSRKPSTLLPAEDSMDLFIENFIKRNRKAFGRPAPQESYDRPVLTSHQYGWKQGTLEQFGRLNIRLR